MTHLCKLFRARRVEKGLSPRQLAELAGYKNVNKGTTRIQPFESSGKVAPDLFAKIGPDESVVLPMIKWEKLNMSGSGQKPDR
jgi:hypothetical protein